MRRRVGQNVKRLRLAAGLTQEQFAERSGFGQQYISDLERGRRNPTVMSLYELAQARLHLQITSPPRLKKTSTSEGYRESKLLRSAMNTPLVKPTRSAATCRISFDLSEFCPSKSYELYCLIVPIAAFTDRLATTGGHLKKNRIGRFLCPKKISLVCDMTN
ncbi:hypothetical protein CSW64_07570 [Caulobacter mirabilis]|uniref:HTH cro/C1-type domain-containing protein n=2 Tax=Caulobacter mirabilis TaxID=69666 RepID=A0A2D2B3X2_9CAUL|nr:hypothetical protein CSW64_07570 [Caulobacter mirabilis]